VNETREIVVRIQLEYPADRETQPAVAVTADQPLLYRVAEAAKLLAIGVSAVNELIACGDLESVKIGASRRIPHEDLVAYVKRLKAEGREGVGAAA
jgi:excisionase family DNA binding protein